MAQFRLLKVKKILKRVNDLAAEMRALSDEELQGQTTLLKEQLAAGKTIDEILPRAYATVREADYRILGMFPYDVQVMGAIVLNQGNIAEMKTGEGKTLTATMPLYLNALSGQGAMLLTPNDYLAQRDEEQLRPVYEWLGLTVSTGFRKEKSQENQKVKPAVKRKWYEADIVYTTATNLAFDYLFNNLATNKDEQYLRPFNYVIIDEVDAILLDEATSPFVVSSTPILQSNLYHLADEFVHTLHSKVDYKLNQEQTAVWLTLHGIRQAQRFFRIDDLFNDANREIYRHIVLALRAHFIMRNGHDYLVSEGKVVLLDETNGRLKKGVKVSTGLHQAIEEKEKVKLTQNQRVAASITFPSLFGLFNKVSGMSGTVKSDEQEFFQVYKMRVIQIPTRKEVIRHDYPDKIYLTTRQKLSEAIRETIQLHNQGRPILLVAGSVENSEIISELLLDQGIPHNVLNAYSAAYEAQIVKGAGQKGAVTIATNMAGRGTDIKLGKGVKELGGLAVIGTEMLPKRVELQLAGRAGRQGDPGSSQFFISLEDDFISGHNTSRQKRHYRRLIKKKKKGRNVVVLKSPVLKFSLHMLRDRVASMQELERSQTNKNELILSLQRKNYYDLRNRIMKQQNLQGRIDQIIDQAISYYLEKYKITDRDSLKYFINQHVTYNKVVIPDDINGSKEIKQYLKSFVYQLVEEKKKILITDKQINDFYRQIIISAMDSCWIDQVDVIEKLKISARGWNRAGRPQELLHHQAAFKLYLKFLDKITLAVFNNLMLSRINVNEKGQLIVVFN